MSCQVQCLLVIHALIFRDNAIYTRTDAQGIGGGETSEAAADSLVGPAIDDPNAYASPPQVDRSICSERTRTRYSWLSGARLVRVACNHL